MRVSHQCYDPVGNWRVGTITEVRFRMELARTETWALALATLGRQRVTVDIGGTGFQ